MISFGRHFYPTGLKPEITCTISIIKDVADELELDVILSSAIDRTHSRGSLHYVGLAIDIYWERFTQFDGDEFRVNLKEQIGVHYDVVLEGDHVHVEYQPKEPVNAIWRD